MPEALHASPPWVLILAFVGGGVFFIGIERLLDLIKGRLRGWEEASGTTTKTIRYYEANALLPPAARTTGGYRDFPPEIIARLDFIRRGRTAGLRLTNIREVLDIRDAGRTPCQHVHSLLAERLANLDDQIGALQGLRATVSQLHENVAFDEPDTNDAGQVCRYL